MTIEELATMINRVRELESQKAELLYALKPFALAWNFGDDGEWGCGLTNKNLRVATDVFFSLGGNL